MQTVVHAERGSKIESDQLQEIIFGRFGLFESRIDMSVDESFTSMVICTGWWTWWNQRRVTECVFWVNEHCIVSLVIVNWTIWSIIENRCVKSNWMKTHCILFKHCKNMSHLTWTILVFFTFQLFIHSLPHLYVSDCIYRTSIYCWNNFV